MPDWTARLFSAEMLGRLFVLAVLLVFMATLRELMGVVPPPGNIMHGAVVALGFLLLAAYLAGAVLDSLGLPRITGYILLGLLVGPSVLGLVTDANLAQVRLIDDIAISLIALTAGGELKIWEVRERSRSMLGITGIGTAAIFIVIFAGILLFSPLLPFTAGRELAAVAVIALLFASISIASSPSVAIAVINDTGSRGPVSSTVLGVTVLKDIAVILFFAVALSVARTVLTPAGGFEVDFFLELAWEIGGSLAFGALAGWLISLYLRFVKTHVVLLALAAAFLNAYFADVLHLEVLLISLSAGFFIENVSPVRGEPFIKGLEANSLPLYALFFSIAGATIHLGELAVLWPVALGLVGARAAAVFGGTWLGARVTNSEPQVRRYAWLGFISQAGVTLGMVIIAARAFPEWGVELQTLFVSMVAIHELVGPILLQYALTESGEIGARGGRGARRRAVAHSVREGP